MTSVVSSSSESSSLLSSALLRYLSLVSPHEAMAPAPIIAKAAAGSADDDEDHQFVRDQEPSLLVLFVAWEEHAMQASLVDSRRKISLVACTSLRLRNRATGIMVAAFRIGFVLWVSMAPDL
jgi:hypothetical protein